VGSATGKPDAEGLCGENFNAADTSSTELLFEVADAAAGDDSATGGVFLKKDAIDALPDATGGVFAFVVDIAKISPQCAANPINLTHSDQRNSNEIINVHVAIVAVPYVANPQLHTSQI
jgi:hypothetical protein